MNRLVIVILQAIITSLFAIAERAILQSFGDDFVPVLFRLLDKACAARRFVEKDEFGIFVCIG